MSLQIISGTNRPGNLSVLLARSYQASFQALDIASEVVNLEELPLDILVSDLYGKRSPAFLPFQNRIKENQFFLFIVPEYNGSIPGILKVFIDACDYPDTFEGKQAWLVGLGAGDGGNVAGLSHLRDILEFLGTTVHGEQLTISKIRERMDETGKLLETGCQQGFQRQVACIAAALKS